MGDKTQIDGIIRKHLEDNTIGGLAGAMELRGSGKKTNTIMVKLVPAEKRKIGT